MDARQAEELYQKLKQISLTDVPLEYTLGGKGQNVEVIDTALRRFAADEADSSSGLPVNVPTSEPWHGNDAWVDGVKDALAAYRRVLKAKAKELRDG